VGKSFSWNDKNQQEKRRLPKRPALFVKERTAVNKNWRLLLPSSLLMAVGAHLLTAFVLINLRFATFL